MNWKDTARLKFITDIKINIKKNNWHDLVPVLGLYSQNKLIFHCIHDFDKYQVILNLSLYLDIFPLFSLKSIADMVLEYSDKVKKKSWYQKFYRLSRPFHKQTAE